MALRFRKSFSLGKLFKVNLSKSGIGVSAGVPGFRMSLSPKGKVRRTVSIPGTGIYSMETIGDVKKTAQGGTQTVTAAQRVCPDCGRRVGKTANFCSHCGNTLS
ncbi:MAG TPA: hypothetical protein DF292_11985 [Firmicutes bacterium]|nr:hypothetical protein [Bacillota bacterium]HCT37730.1 hypothetical protein [Bacillota bacterium]